MLAACAAGSGAPGGEGAGGGNDGVDALVGRNSTTPPAGGGSAGWGGGGSAGWGGGAGTGGAATTGGVPGLGGAAVLPSGGGAGAPDASSATGGDGGAPGTAPPTGAPTAAPTAAPTGAPTAAPTEPPGCVPAAEVCNGADDDCDGAVDEHGACGAWLEARCRLFLAWADSRQGPPGASAVWGPCPALAEGRQGDDLRCTSTRGDGRFLHLDLGGNVNDDDQLGVALLCDDPAEPEVAAWTSAHCALYLGHADDGNGAPEGSPVWGACPDDIHSNAGAQRCTSTGYDGQFRPLNLTGDVDDNDDLGVAWICRDPADPARAAAMQASAEVFFGQADENLGPPAGSNTWGSCPGAPNVARGEIRCTGTSGDGRFHRFRMEGDVDGNDELGLALRARLAP